MSRKTRTNTHPKQRSSNGPWRPQAATGLPIQSSENQGPRSPSNPFAVAQGGHHSLGLFPLSLVPLPLPIHPLSLALAGAFGSVRKLRLARGSLF
jgi:hypothetical protein